MLRTLWLNLIDFLYPKSAQIYELESLSPSDLLQKLPGAEGVEGDIVAIFAYHDPRVRELIYELKYRKNMKIVESFATIALDVVRAELADRALFENFVNPLLVPIPMSTKKLRERGWNQTEILAEEIMKLLVPRSLGEVGDTDLPAGRQEKLLEYRPSALTKTHTESQTLTKNKKERLKNVEGSMKASGVSGRNIILLDDVTTTGATFKEAKRTLREAGAKKIFCLALAH